MTTPTPTASRRRYRLCALAPIHVGSGRTLARDIDYVEEDTRTHFLDNDRICELLASQPAALEEVSTGRFDAWRALEWLRMKPERVARRTVAGRIDAPHVLEIARNAAGAPLLPGSALKGALRTLVVWALSFDFDEKTRDWVPSREASVAMKHALAHRPAGEGHGHFDRGDDTPADALERLLLLPQSVRRHGVPAAGRDLMRALAVGDATLKDDDLEVARARVLTQTEGGAAWKAAEHEGRARLRPDDPQAAAVGVEAFKTGAVADVSLRFSGLFELLRSTPDAAHQRLYEAGRGELDFEPWRIDVPFQIAIHSRNLGLALCHRERRFYEERKLFDLARWYTALEQQIQKAAGTEAIFARVGWGAGWEAMTGGVAVGPARDEARRRFALGRPDYEFPKSRKIALDGSKPARPFGWIRLDPIA